MYLGDHTKSFGSMEQNRDVEVRDGGYVRGGVGGSTFTNSGVDGSSFLSPIFLIRTLFPNILCSTKQFPILHLLFYSFCAQSATLSLIV